jgi:hypothetical protein
MLQGTNLGMAWFYEIAGAWVICLTNLEEYPVIVDSGQRWLLRHNPGCRRGPPPVNLWLQELDRKLTGVHLLLLGRINGSKWQQKIMFDSSLGFGAFLNLWAKIQAQSAGIYRGFGTYA